METEMKFWVGSNDVAPHGFSGLCEISAGSLDEAKQKAEIQFGNLPVDRRRKDKTLRLAVVPKKQMPDIRSASATYGPNGIRIPRRYIVELSK
jgi:hypothetical protein